MDFSVKTVNVTIRRNFSSLPKQSRQRIREYVSENRDVKSELLAEELFLPITTIRSLKAGITRTEENASWDYRGCFKLPDGSIFQG